MAAMAAVAAVAAMAAVAAVLSLRRPQIALNVLRSLNNKLRRLLVWCAYRDVGGKRCSCPDRTNQRCNERSGASQKGAFFW